jgi:hypothetical protein
VLLSQEVELILAACEQVVDVRVRVLVHVTR